MEVEGGRNVMKFQARNKLVIHHFFNASKIKVFYFTLGSRERFIIVPLSRFYFYLNWENNRESIPRGVVSSRCPAISQLLLATITRFKITAFHADPFDEVTVSLLLSNIPNAVSIHK